MHDTLFLFHYIHVVGKETLLLVSPAHVPMHDHVVYYFNVPIAHARYVCGMITSFLFRNHWLRTRCIHAALLSVHDTYIYRIQITVDIFVNSPPSPKFSCLTLSFVTKRLPYNFILTLHMFSLIIQIKYSFCFIH